MMREWLRRWLGIADVPRETFALLPEGQSAHGEPGDEVIRCPSCGTEKPGLSRMMLRNDVKRRGEHVAVIAGDVKECQECGCMYAAWKHGTFIPWCAKRKTVTPEVTGPSDEEQRPPAGAVRPIPKERSRI